jgi:hypothetical protein
MKRPITTSALLLFTFYLVWCLRAFWTPPPLDFIDLPDEADRQVVSGWYRSAFRISRQPWDLESLGHALAHPLAPHRFHPSVTEGGLGGKESVMVSYCGFIGIFTRTGPGGALEFQWLESLE